MAKKKPLQVSFAKRVLVSDSSSEDDKPEEKIDSDSGESETNSESESETEPPPSPTISTKHKTKRPSEEASASVNAKRPRKDEKEMEPETDTKKSYFQRLWSEEDEIVILQGMIDFKAETGKNPSENMNGFYESVKKSITYEAKNLNQFISKIHSLKKKFTSKKKKGSKLSFAKPNDEKCFELSKVIWGSDIEKPTKKIKVESLGPEGEETDGNWFVNSFLVGSISRFGMDEETVKQKWSKVPLEVKKKLEEKWRAFEEKQLEFVSYKIGFVHEVASVLP